MFPFSSPHFSNTCNLTLMPPFATQMYYLPLSPLSYFETSSPFQTYNYDSFYPAPHLLEFQVAPTNSTQKPQTYPPEKLPQTPERSALSASGKLERTASQENEEPKQKFGRNICSNIFHLMVKYVKKEKSLRTRVARIIQSKAMTIKVHEFYQMLKNRSYKLKPYANSQKIREFWQGVPQSSGMSSRARKEFECNRIFRIVGRHYLEYYHFPYVYGSLKIKSASKRLHMDAIRKILSL